MVWDGAFGLTHKTNGLGDGDRGTGDSLLARLAPSTQLPAYQAYAASRAQRTLRPRCLPPVPVGVPIVPSPNQNGTRVHSLTWRIGCAVATIGVA